MRMVLIPDKFKGSLTAAEVTLAIEKGVRSVIPGAEFMNFPASDGGDGFLEAVRAARPRAEYMEALVADPLGRPVRAAFLWDRDTREAFVELAAASGMSLLDPTERDPGKTSTLGTGELIREAISLGARRVFAGLGGSATNDGGCGLALAFGFRFLDAKGNPVHPSGENLGNIHRIVPPEGPSFFQGVDLVAVNDVSNPLHGPDGAAFTYAPQKGARPGQVPLLDQGLRHLERLVQEQLGKGGCQVPGSGAAGGAAFGLCAFLGARFVSGAHYVLEISGVEAYLEGHKVDFICTGEGRLDRQTLHGKLLQAVVGLANRHGVPVLAVCGKCDLTALEVKDAGFRAVIEVADPDRGLAYNMEHAEALTSRTVSEFFSSLPGGSLTR
ncbi:glycerate kinase [Robiginitalea marina]|uniref:Glycerate kinase n=1 Tax=Robiginitalea marina TaxID=2954105 RepID=A0ABT1AVB5_9FLAO|nr:glycerate kinase [Robiginitalea marina]MCO5723864.1 glycerate kinase [Robiginitalea marina]